MKQNIKKDHRVVVCHIPMLTAFKTILWKNSFKSPIKKIFLKPTTSTFMKTEECTFNISTENFFIRRLKIIHSEIFLVERSSTQRHLHTSVLEQLKNSLYEKPGLNIWSNGIRQVCIFLSSARQPLSSVYWPLYCC